MIDSHIHLSHKHFDQTFPYIAYCEGEFCIVNDGNREGLIKQMKDNGIRCCIEPAIDVDSSEKLLKLSEEYPDFIYSSVGNHPTMCIYSQLSDFKRVKSL